MFGVLVLALSGAGYALVFIDTLRDLRGLWWVSVIAGMLALGCAVAVVGLVKHNLWGRRIALAVLWLQIVTVTLFTVVASAIALNFEPLLDDPDQKLRILTGAAMATGIVVISYMAVRSIRRMEVR